MTKLLRTSFLLTNILLILLVIYVLEHFKIISKVTARKRNELKVLAIIEQSVLHVKRE